MAYWGIAMTWYHPIWSPPTPSDLAAGKTATSKAMELGGKTDRERGYIDALTAFYRDSETVPHGPRAKAYENAMRDLSRRLPDDHEATIFYALALLGTAPPSDTTYANQKKAAAILNALLPLEPQHPGITHYMIHSFDFPALAAEALPAARTYAKIAPDSPHALHMPSHIFTRIGLWEESIASNIDSAAAARRLVAKYQPGATSYDALHAMDYLEYAYLQVGDLEHARKVLEEAEAAKKFDSAQFQGGYALVAIPARWTLERRDWKAAAALEVPDVSMPWNHFMYAPATTWFARALGSAHTGQLDRARAAAAKLQEIQAGLAKSPIPGPYDWAANVESLRLAAAAWIAFAEGKKDEALRLARGAAELDEKAGKHPVTPGAILPPRELLADMLMESGKPAEALAEYEASLREAPGRFNSLAGGARAADLSKNPARARELYAKLIEQCVQGSPRPELAEARRVMGPQKTSWRDVDFGDPVRLGGERRQ
jgi:tetratricopeptide (TPR) repeat protein